MCMRAADYFVSHLTTGQPRPEWKRRTVTLFSSYFKQARNGPLGYCLRAVWPAQDRMPPAAASRNQRWTTRLFRGGSPCLAKFPHGR